MNEKSVKTTLCFIVLMAGVCVAKAQENAAACKKIIVANDRVILAQIDSVSSDLLFYKKCPGPTDRGYTVPLSVISSILDASGNPDALYSPALAKNKPPKRVKPAKIQWVFRHKARKTMRKIMDGQRVKVVYQKAGGFESSAKGKWKKLTETDLVLSTDEGFDHHIPKADVLKIIFNDQRPAGKTKRILGWALAFVGAGLAAFWLLLGSVDLLASTTQPDPKVRSKIGCLLPLAVIASALILLLTDKKTIDYPFQGEWEITNVAADGNPETSAEMP